MGFLDFLEKKGLNVLENTSDGYNDTKEALTSNMVPAC